MANDHESRRRFPRMGLTVVIMVLVLYPLSIGPLGGGVCRITGGPVGAFTQFAYYTYCAPMRGFHAMGWVPEWYWDYLQWFIPPDIPQVRKP